MLRWIAQHQGGYPVEFYPLGEAWLEVAVRALSLGTLPAEGAHTLAIIALFLAPGAAFAALAHQDGWSPAVGLIAFVLHISLPGGWYDGGYTELVQWGLVTNVAGAVAAFCMLPAIVRFLRTGAGGPGLRRPRLAPLLSIAIPDLCWRWLRLGWGRGSPGFFAPSQIFDTWIGSGCWRFFGPRRRDAGDVGVAPTAAHHRFLTGPSGYCNWRLTMRLALVAVLTGLLAAPEHMALARFRDLYTFVQYSGYTELTAYAVTAANAHLARPRPGTPGADHGASVSAAAG